jgi:hypothetical protein
LNICVQNLETAQISAHELLPRWIFIGDDLRVFEEIILLQILEFSNPTPKKLCFRLSAAANIYLQRLIFVNSNYHISGGNYFSHSQYLFDLGKSEFFRQLNFSNMADLIVLMGKIFAI